MKSCVQLSPAGNVFPTCPLTCLTPSVFPSQWLPSCVTMHILSVTLYWNIYFLYQITVEIYAVCLSPAFSRVQVELILIGVCVVLYVCLCVCRCIHICVGHRLIPSSTTSPLYFWREGLSQNLFSRISCLVSYVDPALFLPSTRVTGMCYSTWLFMWMLGIWAWVLLLMHQTFYWQSYLSSSWINFLKRTLKSDLADYEIKISITINGDIVTYIMYIYITINV